MSAEEFPQHYQHIEAEPRLRQLWDQLAIYRFNPEAKDKPIFSVDTPPPYVSADHLHVGHAMSYSQAEFVVRYQRMRGKNIFYPMGFDDNGLPTERFVEKKYKINKNKITRKEFVELCLKETAKGAETYRNLWQALGISVDWNLTYSTIDERCRKTAQLSFLDLCEKKLIERREEPIIWCYQCQTSLAQADVETNELSSALHEIVFKSAQGKDLIIATTRPELIPACVALYVHPEDERYLDLQGKKARVPILDYEVPIKTDHGVDKEYGTGLMMVCTWGDLEDVRKWKDHGLETRMIFSGNGVLNELAGPFKGEHYTKAREKILTMLKEKGLHRKSTSLTHTVGVHERCETPIDFNIAPQWFIKTIAFKDELLKRGDELKWHPEFMKVRYEQWVRDLKWDWNISRQRYYGVPFPVWYCKECKSSVIAEREQLPVDPTLDSPPISQCPKCKAKEFIPEADVMDTWMTSSLTPLINSQWAQWSEKKDVGILKKIYPMSIRPQAFEIIRTWLFYTVLKSHLHTQSLPWTDVMISGWGLDPNGKKISKRSGNFVEVDKIIEKYSADALRYWAAGSTLGHDLRYSEKDVASGRKIVVKLWNAVKFVSSNLKEEMISDLYGNDKTPASTVLIDHWVMSHLESTLKAATTNLDEFEYSHALRATERFFWLIFCDNYLEIVKDRFWNPDAYPKDAILSAHQTLYFVSRNLLKLFAPFMPYITEELWQRFFTVKEKIGSIHIAAWPAANAARTNSQAETAGDLLLTCLVPVRKFKSLHQIHQNTVLASLKLHAGPEIKEELKGILADLASASRAKEVLIVEPMAKMPENAMPTEKAGLSIEVKVAE